MRRELDLREKKINDLMKLSGEKKNHSEIKIVEICDFNVLTKKMYDQIDQVK